MMKKYIFTITLFFLFTSFSLAQEPKLFLEKTSIDLGQLKDGQIYQGSFSVENKGESELVIKTVQASCSCVKIQDDKDTENPT